MPIISKGPPDDYLEVGFYTSILSVKVPKLQTRSLNYASSNLLHAII